MTDIDAMVAWLRDQIAEDAGWAQDALDLADYLVTREWRWVRFSGHPDHPNLPPSSSFYRGAPSPERVLTQCEAHLKILAEHSPYDTMAGGVGIVCSSCAGGGGFNADWPCRTIRVLTAVYVDRPGYRDEWRP